MPSVGHPCTKTAVSQQIAKLEDSLGARLFDRTKRRVALTEPGKIFLGEARTALRQIETAAAMARRAALGQVGRLTIAYVETAPFGALPSIVLAFRQAHPEVHLELREMITGEQIEALRSGRIDAGLLQPMWDDASLASLLLQSEPYLVALPADHPLAAATSVALADLRDEPFLTASSAKSRYIDERFRRLFSRLGFRPRIVQEVNQIHAIAGLVSGGLVVVLVPSCVSKMGLDGVAYRPIRDREAPDSQMAIAWLKDRDAPVVSRFVDIARKTTAATERPEGLRRVASRTMEIRWGRSGTRVPEIEGATRGSIGPWRISCAARRCRGSADNEFGLDCVGHGRRAGRPDRRKNAGAGAQAHFI
jgi:DNA-binding transcriptional LysR family regulator